MSSHDTLPAGDATAGTASRPQWFARLRAHVTTPADGLAARVDNFLLLRFLAAALVIYGHGYAMVVHAPDAADVFISLGWSSYSGTIGVDLFFVISGFLVTGSFVRRRDLLAFAWARALRLLPAYVACLLLSTFVLGTLYTTLAPGDYLRDPHTTGYVLDNLQLGRNMRWSLPGVFTDNPRRDTINGSIWTLPIEVRMYAWVALLGAVGLLARRGVATLAVLALLLAGWLMPEYVPALGMPGATRLGGMFALGALCWLYRDVVPVHGALLALLAAACWALRATSLHPLVFALAEVQFVFWFAYRLRWHGFNRFGDYSYGLYLWGFPMQQVVAHHWPQASPTFNSVVAFVPAMLLGVASWHALEKPLLAFKDASARARAWIGTRLRRAGARAPRLHDALAAFGSSTRLQYAGVAGFVLAAAFYAATALAVVANFRLPLPGASPMLHVALGAFAVALAAALVVATILRERTWPRLVRAAACALVGLAFGWLGNARMLVYGDTPVRAFLVVVGCVLALLSTRAAAGSDRPLPWLIGAGLAATAATASARAGVAVFMGVLALGTVLRLRRRDLALVVAWTVGILLVYGFARSGDDSASASLALDPLVGGAAVLRWLASPWMHALFGLGDPTVQAWMPAAVAPRAGEVPLVDAARSLGVRFGARPALLEGLLLGAAGLAAWVFVAVQAWRSGRDFARMRALAFGLSSFALGAAIVTGFAHADRFATTPELAYAAPYLPWSSLFWLGLGLYALGSVTVNARAAATFAVAMVLMLFLPSHRMIADACAVAYRQTARSMLVARLGMRDAGHVPDTMPAGLQHGFASPPEQSPGWHAPARPWPPAPDGAARFVRGFDDAPSGHRVAAFEGWFPRVRGRGRDPLVAVVDADGALRGLAAIDFIGPGRRSLRLNVPAKRGFDGYVIDPRPGEQLTVVMLDDERRRVLAAIPLTVDPEP